MAAPTLSASSSALCPGTSTLKLETRHGAAHLVHVLTGEAVLVDNCILSFAPNGAGVLQQLANPGEQPQVVWAQHKLSLAVEVDADEELWLVEGRRTHDERRTLLKKWHAEHTMLQVTFKTQIVSFPVFDASVFPNSVCGARYWWMEPLDDLIFIFMFALVFQENILCKISATTQRAHYASLTSIASK